MAGYSRKAKPMSRKPYNRRRRVARDGVIRAPRSVALSSWNVPFRTTLKYADVGVVTTTLASGFTTYVLSANSLFDPNVEVSGHQPLRFDQLAAMFNSYRVRASTLKATFAIGEVAMTSSALGPWRISITKSRTNATLPGLGSDFATAAEMEGSTTGVMTTQEKLTLYNKYDWSDLGVNNIEEANAVVSGNPSIPFYWIISVYNQGNVAATSTLVNFDISFDCEFINPKTIATS